MSDSTQNLQRIVSSKVSLAKQKFLRSRLAKILPVLSVVVAAAAWIATNQLETHARELKQAVQEGERLGILTAQLNLALFQGDAILFELGSASSYVKQTYTKLTNRVVDEPRPNPDGPEGPCALFLGQRLGQRHQAGISNEQIIYKLIVEAQILQALQTALKAAGHSKPNIDEIAKKTLAFRDAFRKAWARYLQEANELEAKLRAPDMSNPHFQCDALKTYMRSFDELAASLSSWDKPMDQILDQIIPMHQAAVDELAALSLQASRSATLAKYLALALTVLASALALVQKWTEELR